MKKRFLFLCVLLVCGIQTPKAQLSFSVEGGLNFSTVRLIQQFPFTPQLRGGVFIGIVPKIKLSKKIFIRSDVQYSKEGAGANVIEVNGGKPIFDYQYLRIIPQLEYFHWEDVGFHAGANFGTLAHRKKHEGDLASNDFGIAAGTTYYKNNWSVGLHYYYGLKNVTTINFLDEAGNPTEGYGQLNRNVQFAVGYNIGN